MLAPTPKSTQAQIATPQQQHPLTQPTSMLTKAQKLSEIRRLLRQHNQQREQQQQHQNNNNGQIKRKNMDAVQNNNNNNTNIKIIRTHTSNQVLAKKTVVPTHQVTVFNIDKVSVFK